MIYSQRQTTSCPPWHDRREEFKTTTLLLSIDIDEISSYKSLTISADEQKLLADDGGIIEFWLRRVQTFSIISQVAIRLCISPASNASSERDFSHLNIYCDNSLKMNP